MARPGARIAKQLTRNGERGVTARGQLQVAKMMTPASDRFIQTLRNPSQAEPVEIWKARNFIRENFTDKISLTKIAKMVNISPSHLSEKFKEVTGTKFVDYIARIRFEKACEVLQNSHRRVSEIAFATGFQSLSQFNRVFKKLCGKSPTEYRGGQRSPSKPIR